MYVGAFWKFVCKPVESWSSQKGGDRFDECLAFVREHGLYKHALTIFTDPQSHENRVIGELYGSHLMEHGKLKEAGIGQAVLWQIGEWCTVLISFVCTICPLYVSVSLFLFLLFLFLSSNSLLLNFFQCSTGVGSSDQH